MITDHSSSSESFSGNKLRHGSRLRSAIGICAGLLGCALTSQVEAAPVEPAVPEPFPEQAPSAPARPYQIALRGFAGVAVSTLQARYFDGFTTVLYRRNALELPELSPGFGPALRLGVLLLESKLGVSLGLGLGYERTVHRAERDGADGVRQRVEGGTFHVAEFELRFARARGSLKPYAMVAPAMTWLDLPDAVMSLGTSSPPRSSATIYGTGLSFGGGVVWQVASWLGLDAGVRCRLLGFDDTSVGRLPSSTRGSNWTVSLGPEARW
jgi:hypothetical protein